MTQSPLCITQAACLSSLGLGLNSGFSYYCAHPSFSEIASVPVFSLPDVLASYRPISKNPSPIPFSTLDRVTQISVALTEQFQKHSNGVLGVFIGSSRGATHSFESSYRTFLQESKVPTPTSPLTTLGNIASWSSQVLQSDGWACSHSVTCSTSLHSVIQAAAWIWSGLIDEALCGGVEASLTPYTVAQMKALRIYSPYPPPFPCRPLAKSDGYRPSTFTLGEGGGLFLIKKQEECFLPPLATINGFGFSKESITNLTGLSETGDGFYDAMKASLINSNQSSTIDAIILHAPGTLKGDAAELYAIRKLFPKMPMLLSTKYVTGHTLGAAGALNMSYALSLLSDFSPPLTVPNYESHLSKFTDHSNRLNSIMVNAAGFGGNAVSIILSRSS